MRKNIDLDKTTLLKLKILAAFEDTSVKALIEKLVERFVKEKEHEQLQQLSKEEKEDLGLLALMQQSDRDEYVSRDEVMKVLDE
ncbi:hypothetical protein BST92_07350 [Nonlabens arenilitoris]|uniref:CopG family transcriptional regulator n=1 Tax=Nonlabens arenilitoris TaxID=1217969 RepID=A0A2S7UAU4_9FLAO|nr:hypothetical protein [Nonlabens arenilitoris]PQJ31750.1 hypothetical protein BST92_07350 [Nonlabens arenilitoris]